MKESREVRDAYVRFCERLSAGDVASFDELVSADARLIVGTAPGELVRDRARMRYGFEVEGLRLEPREPEAYEEDALGWVFDEPAFVFPDGSTVRVRLTVVLRREGEHWRIVHAHFSVGVPDEEVVALQARWDGESSVSGSTP